MKKFLYFFLNLSVITISCSKTGKEDIVYSTSDWINQIISFHSGKDIALTDISIPASHDAGTYILTNCTPGANACNTQTQHLDMKTQMEAGVRIFDIRPVLFNGEYYTQHITDCNGYGCKGDLIENVLRQAKSFLDVHAELVILKFGNFCGTGADDTTFTGMINDILRDRIYKEPVGESQSFINRPLKDIISNSGKAVIIYNGTLQDSPASRANGMFTGSILPAESKWSNTPVFNVLKADQLALFSNFNNSGSTLFELSWTLTQDAQLAVYCALSMPDTISIWRLAEQANGELKPTIDELIENGSIKKGKIPNIISVDFADKFVTEQCIRLSDLNIN